MNVYSLGIELIYNIYQVMNMDMKKSMEIWEEVKANHKKLDNCTSHDFTEVINKENMARTKYKCTNCGGTVDFIAKHWYEKGREHEATNVQSV